ncbi:MAG TPA: hypothetical protein EYP14_07895 [Planctomycetaceae bacterium]|nr:hypothetical protein [Planctomycetaceae bacterium]
MNIEITDRERELLLDILRDRLGTLREQIHHARTFRFREMLKDMQQVLKELIEKLDAAGQPTAAAGSRTHGESP